MNELGLLVPMLLGVPLQAVGVCAVVLAVMHSDWLSGGIVANQGLWKKCYNDTNMCFFLPAHDWVTLCRLMAILGCLSALMGVGFMLMLFVKPIVNRHRQMRKRISFATLIAVSAQVVLVVLTLCVYWSKNIELVPGVGITEAAVSIVLGLLSLLCLSLYLLRLNRFFEAQERKRLTKDQADNYE